VTSGSIAPNEHRRPFYNYNSYNRSRPEGDGQEANLDGRTQRARKGTKSTQYRIPTNPSCLQMFERNAYNQKYTLRQRTKKFAPVKHANELKIDFKGNRLTLRTER